MATFYFFYMRFKFKKWIYISIENPFKTMKKLKEVFKPLKCYFRCNFKDHYPILWCSKPSIIHIVFRDVTWKDKFDSPRYENCPYIWIHILNLDLIWYWDLPPIFKFIAPKEIVDDYWEQALWYIYYTPNHNIKEAKKTWPWKQYNSYTSTWNDLFILK